MNLALDLQPVAHSPVARFEEAMQQHDSAVRAVRHQPARAAQFAAFPEALNPALRSALAARGIENLYSHQAAAVELALAGKNAVVVTPTASGKTLCYNLPVIDAILSNPAARAIFLFPTKALAEDQRLELQRLTDAVGGSVASHTYDGDTPQDARRSIRDKANIVLTNPDMLHTGILPHHSNWSDFFSGLKFIIIDEMHTYRGVFGSHVANVIRRLKRVAKFYGADPQFILASATIGNPRELAGKLIEEPVELVEDDGSSRGER
ncbi:MAG: DEAD/DEAH box helicase, partial [bacterium]